MRVSVEALLIAMSLTAILVAAASAGYLTPSGTVAVGKVPANEGFQATGPFRITPIIGAAEHDYDTVAIEFAQAFGPPPIFLHMMGPPEGLSSRPGLGPRLSSTAQSTPMGPSDYPARYQRFPAG